MGREHMRNLALVEGADLIGIADPDEGSRITAKVLAEQLGQKPAIFSDITDLLATCDFDAAIIASPNFTHYSLLNQIMAKNLAILVEKPLCTNTEDALHISEMAANYPELFWVGMEYRYMPPVSRFIERVHAGEPGRLFMMYIREHRFPFLSKVGDWNRFNRNTGGTLVEKCCHFFDLMRYILQDEPKRVFASGAQNVNHLEECYDGETPDIIDNAYVTVDFMSGARAVLDLCMFAEGAEQQEEIYVLGDLGRLDVAIPSANVSWFPREKSGVTIEHIDTPKAALSAGDHHGATYFQLLSFHRCLVSGDKPALQAIDGLRAVQMGVAAQKSIETGLPVELNFTELGE